MIKFDVVTLFPQLFTEHLKNLPFRKAAEEGKAIYNLINLREFSTNNYGSVDDETYGGGVGMILMIEPIFKALSKIYGKEIVEKQIKDKEKTYLEKGERVVLLSPRGKIFNQEIAREFSKSKQITIICGRYEGVDARVEESLATDVISLGNYVLSGGEIPALAIMESITRLLPGILEKEEAPILESFSDKESRVMEYPQYTRPEDFMGLKVPEVLLSGNHKEIEKWRKEKSNTRREDII